MTPQPTVRSPRLWRIVGTRVRAARDAANMTPLVLALTVRISRQALALIETGKKGTRIETLYRIAKATGKPIDYFLPPAEDV